MEAEENLKKIGEDKEEKKKSPLTLFQIPEEIWLKIARKFPAETLALTSRTNKTFERIHNDDDLWIELLSEDLPFEWSEVEVSKIFSSPKNCYVVHQTWQEEIANEKASEKITLLSKLTTIYRKKNSHHINIENHKLQSEQTHALIAQLPNEDIKQKVFELLKNDEEFRAQKPHIVRLSDNFNSNLQTEVMYPIFKALTDTYYTLYQKGNLLAGYELVKLYNNQLMEPVPFAILSFDTSLALDVALELIEKQYLEKKMQHFANRILEGTHPIGINEVIQQNSILDSMQVPILVSKYSEKQIPLEQILCLPSNELRLLVRFFLPFLASEPNNQKKDDYLEFCKDILAAIDEKTYQAKDNSIIQKMTKNELRNLLGLPLFFSPNVDAMGDAVANLPDLSDSEDEDVEEFNSDSDDSDSDSPRP